ncbi:Bcr/CflA family efflux MFS transporter [Pseudodesulfovibrio cashew]|uniref:Bcr/CflA family efflux MFS transporter n=1 Tax=Pseudodesulfovibrio cashew TaxID=2678688 RepID=A0A6I6JL33_9BACT|nr:multidrug effflux MFS transporter [Pseudodesulfovibrio cashew]QGY41688.1 Bcr/CflA family efflux MFS transporter [Pseudodesulfovibrio cashew]
MPNLILLSLLAAFPPLSTDMYLPAIPTLQQEWGIPLTEANLSLVIYFLAFSLCLLIHGPLSDRFGRRPVLLWGILTFIAGCLLCAMSTSIVFLVAARIIQAAGAAAAAALALALSKDLYDGIERQKILGYIGVIMAFCPMLAPSVGGLMLKFASWRWIFASQAVMAVIAFYGVLRLKEPLEEFTSGGFLAVAGRYVAVCRNGRFSTLALAFAFIIFPHFGYIGSSPEIYINGFGLSEQAFGLYFGANAFGFMLGSLACTRFGGYFNPMHMLYFTLFSLLGSGVALFLLGGATPLSVAIPMFAISFSVGFSRPVSNNMILDQVDTDIGAASSIMTFEIFLVGAVSMEIVAMEWASKVVVLSILAVIAAVVPLVGLLFMRSRMRVGHGTPAPNKAGN